MSDQTDHDKCAACSAWWRLPLLLAIVLAAILAYQYRPGREQSAAQPNAPIAEEPIAPSAQQVQLNIDFGDGRAPLSATASWRDGMTVADLLHSAPDVRTETQGDGASTFLNVLNGLANEGGGGRNWLYRVNGKHADRSFAVYELQPGDQVLWTYTKQQ
jgi:hypothetical protein